MHAFLGGDAKLVHAFTPVRAAMDACAAAEAGLTGMPDIFEHPRGFLDRFATVALPEVITAGLGRRWHTDSLSFKLRPGGPGIDAAVDCAIGLHPEIRGAPIEEITVAASAYTIFAGKQAERYLAGEHSPLSALLLSTGYPVATALLTGDLRVSDFEPPGIGDPARWSLAGRVRLVHDKAMTRDLLASTAPFGAALRTAGERGRPWLRAFVGDLARDFGAACPSSDEDFTTSVKATPARLTIRLADGRTLVRERAIPLGAAGPDTRERHRDLVHRKFADQGGDPRVAAALDDLGALSAPAVAALLTTALSC
jgi:2-methylcitrate dehydratase PrpD